MGVVRFWLWLWMLLVGVVPLAMGADAPAVIQAGSNPAGFRDATGLPTMVNIRDPDFGGYADAIKGGVAYAANANHLTVNAVYMMDATVTQTGALTATIAPAFAVPDLAGYPASSFYMDVPAAASGGLAVHCKITSLTNATVTLNSCNNGGFIAGTNAFTSIQIYAAGQPAQAASAGSRYGTIAVSDATDAVTGKVYGSTIALDITMLPRVGSNTNPAMDGLHLCLETASLSWCGVIVGDATNDGKTVTVAGTDNYPTSIPGPGSMTAKVSWGRFLFRPNDASACTGGSSATAGRNVEIPLAGTGNINLGAVTFVTPITPTSSYEGVIATRLDAFSVTLAGSVGTTVSGVEGTPIVGCDDYPALKKAINTVARKPVTSESVVNIFLPGDAFVATSYADGTAISYAMLATMCGNGTVYWPVTNGNIFNHGTATCNRLNAIQSFPDSKDLGPATLRHLNALALSATPGVTTATLVMAGNSPGLPGSNGGNFVSGRLDRVCAAFQQAYPELVWKCIDRSLGGQQMNGLDPNGISNGRPVNLGSLTDWYSDLSVTWLVGKIQPDNPDVLILGFSDQESVTMQLSAILNIQATTQGTAWAATMLSNTGASFNPDMIFMPWPYQPTGMWSQASTNHAASIQRAYAKACVTKLAGGGCWGLIDEARMQSILVDGYDPETMPMRRAQGLPGRDGSQISTFPWVDQVPRVGMSLFNIYLAANATPSGTLFFSTIGGELDYTIGGAVNTVPQLATPTAKTTAIAAASQAVVTIGTADIWRVSVGEKVTGGAGGIIPTNTRIASINTGAGTVTLSANLTGAGLASGVTLTFTPPGPSIGYPGNTLRIGVDVGGTGNLWYRYDTVYFQTTGADCSATSGTATVTCTTPEIGNWHRGMQIALPGGGTDPCPQPGGGSTCFVGTINTTTFNAAGNETITLTAGKTAALGMSATAASVTTTVTNVAPYVYRTSIPKTVTTVSPDAYLGAAGTTGGSNCLLTGGVRVQIADLVEYRGSRLSYNYCALTAPGPNWLFKRFVERWDSPFQYTIDTPSHGGTGVTMYGPGPLYASGGLSLVEGRGLQTMAVDLDHPSVAPTSRLAPDIFGWCANMPYGDVNGSIWAGQCAAHYGQNGAFLIDDPILSQLRR